MCFRYSLRKFLLPDHGKHFLSPLMMISMNGGSGGSWIDTGECLILHSIMVDAIAYLIDCLSLLVAVYHMG